MILDDASDCRDHSHGVVLLCTMLSICMFSIECFGLWVAGLVFSLNGLDESGCGLWATLVPNNREGMKERTRNVVEGSESVVSGLGHANPTCLSGAV